MSTPPAAEWQARFLTALRAKPIMTPAASAAGVSLSTVYRHRDENPTFAALIAVAIDEGADAAENEAWRRAVEGVDKPIYQGGVYVGDIREYSDGLLRSILASHRPERFGRQIRAEVTGDADKPLAFVDILARARAVHANPDPDPDPPP